MKKREVNTVKYVAVYGKQPRGYAMWFFGNRAGTIAEGFSGTYAEAKAKALKWANEHMNDCESLYLLT